MGGWGVARAGTYIYTHTLIGDSHNPLWESLSSVCVFSVSGVGEMKFNDFSDFAATKKTSCGCFKTGGDLR